VQVRVGTGFGKFEFFIIGKKIGDEVFYNLQKRQDINEILSKIGFSGERSEFKRSPLFEGFLEIYKESSLKNSFGKIIRRQIPCSRGEFPSLQDFFFDFRELAENFLLEVLIKLRIEKERSCFPSKKEMKVNRIWRISPSEIGLKMEEGLS
jgi:hypothetical protein